MAIEQDNHQSEKKRYRGIEKEKSECMRDNRCMRTGICPKGMVPTNCDAILVKVRSEIANINDDVLPAGGAATMGLHLPISSNTPSR